jgi:hypothetical protein
MAVLQSDDPKISSNRFGSRSRAMLKELREKSLTFGWAAAVLITTAGWLYFVARAISFIVNWFFW